MVNGNVGLAGEHAGYRHPVRFSLAGNGGAPVEQAFLDVAPKVQG